MFPIFLRVFTQTSLSLSARCKAADPLPFSNYSCWCWTSIGVRRAWWIVLEGAIKLCVAATAECIYLCALSSVRSASTGSWGRPHCQRAQVRFITGKTSALSWGFLKVRNCLCLSGDALRSKCQLARSQALRASARSDSFAGFIPECKADGTYTEVLWC